MSAPGRAESIDEAKKPRRMHSDAAKRRKHELAKNMKSPNFSVDRSISKHANKQDKHHELVHVKRHSLIGSLKGKAAVLNEARKLPPRESIDLMSGRKHGAIGSPSKKMKYG